MRVLMATLAQRHACIWIVLPDVMGIAWAYLVAYAARQFLYPLDMRPFF